MSKKELVKSDNSLVTKDLYADLMDDVQVDPRDVLLPKIMIMQGLSKMVAEEKATMGDIRDSINNTLLAAKEGSVAIIPFHFTKSWVIFEEGEYKEQIPVSPTNMDWPWDEEVNGVCIRRDQSLNFYCLLPSELATGACLPYIISFRRTSYFAGKKLITAREKLRLINRPLASQVFELISSKQKNDKGTYYVFDIKESRDASQAEMQAVAPWMKLVRTSALKVDDSDLKADVVHQAEVVDSDAY